MSEHAIYKYVYNDEIIYIGRTGSSVLGRVKAHRYEEKFQPYLADAEIYYFICADSAESDFCERILINKYKPILNVSYKSDGNIEVEIKEPEWININQLIEENGLTFNKTVPKRQLKARQAPVDDIADDSIDDDTLTKKDEWEPDIIGEFSFRATVNKNIPLMTISNSPLDFLGLKLIELYLGQINPDISWERGIRFDKFDIEMISSSISLDVDNLDKQLQLLTEPIDIISDSGDVVSIPLFSRCHRRILSDNEWQVDMECSPKGKKYMFELSEGTRVKYNLPDVVRLKNRDSYFLFQYLKQKRFHHTWVENISMLRSFINNTSPINELTDKQFVTHIIIPALNDVNSHALIKYQTNIIPIDNHSDDGSANIRFTVYKYERYKREKDEIKRDVMQKVLHAVTSVDSDTPVFQEWQMKDVCRYIISHQDEVSIKQGIDNAEEAFWYLCNSKVYQEQPHINLWKYYRGIVERVYESHWVNELDD